jgi:hypothetical protein
MTLLEIFGLIGAIVIGIIAVRISLTFDINQFLENRRQIKLNQLKNACPHLKIDVDGENIRVESFFSSPPGTITWGCSQCGLIVNSKQDIKRLQKPFLQNPNLYIEQMEKFNKLAKKLKLY